MHGLRSLIHVYGGVGGWQRSPRQMLFDPAYAIANNSIKNRLQAFSEKGWQIGLHQSYKAWSNTALIKKERETVAAAIGVPVISCRQHWLRFSWRQTWKAQQAVGLMSDSTLGFNDRPGFRNAAALTFHPWDFDQNAPMQLQVTPLIMMDSHLYDYANLNEEERKKEIIKWIAEVRAVHGTATVLWHSHTLSRDYGWKSGFEDLLDVISRPY